MKKLFILFSILFIFNMTHVYADSNLDINIIGVKQGNHYLEYKNGKYIIDSDNEEIYVVYEVNDEFNSEDYSILLSSEDANFEDYTIGEEVGYNLYSLRLYLSDTSPDTNYELKICKEYYDCSETLVSKNFTVNYPNFTENYEKPIFELTKVVQGGIELVPTYDEYISQYNINSYEDLTLNIKAKNLLPNLKYTITYFQHKNYYDYEEVQYTSEQLMDGITINVNTLMANTIDIKLSNAIYGNVISLKEYANDMYYRVSFNKDSMDDLNYELSLKYTGDEMFGSYWAYNIMDRLIYERDGNFYLVIDGNNYLDKDYNVSINISDKNGRIYQKNITVNGLLLNDEYKVLIEDINLKYAKNYSELGSEYRIDVKIDNSSNYINFYYKTNDGPQYTGNLMYANKSKIGRVIAIEDMPYKSSYIYVVSNYALNENSKFLYRLSNSITYYYERFEGDYNFTYNITHGYYKNGNYYNILNEAPANIKLIDDNSDMRELLLEFDLNDYQLPGTEYDDVYRLTVKNGDEIVYYQDLIIERENISEITNIDIYASNYKLPYDEKGPYYLPYNTPSVIKIKGVGFEADKDYILDIQDEQYCYEEEVYDDPPHSCDGCGSGPSPCHDEDREIIVKGSELNRGYTYNMTVNDCNVKDRNIYITTEYNKNIINDYYTYIDYYAISEYVSDDDYTIDEEKLTVRDIPKNTTVDEFLTNNGIEGVAKIYKGDNIVTGVIETGMYLKLYIGYNETEFISIKLVVEGSYLKGDLNGNGRIDLADIIILLKAYLTSEDIDEEVGDINENSRIDLADIIMLLKIYLGN